MKLASTLGNLALALLNATLILAALVLWLGWRTADTVQEISQDYAEALPPLRDDMERATAEIAALRADLAVLRADPDDAPPALSDDVIVRLDRLDARLTEASGLLAQLVAAPDALVGQVIEGAAGGLASAVTSFGACTPPGEG